MAKAAKSVHLQEFADDHGVTVRTVTNWIAEGMPHRTVRGERRVVRREANVWRIEREQTRAANRAAGGRLDKDVEMAKRIRVDRQIRELELRKRLGSLIPADQFETRIDRIVGGFASVAMGQLQPFEREMGLEPGGARALVLRMQEALMQGAQQLADTLDAEADALLRAAAEAEELEETETVDEDDLPVDDLDEEAPAA